MGGKLAKDNLAYLFDAFDVCLGNITVTILEPLRNLSSIILKKNSTSSLGCPDCRLFKGTLHLLDSSVFADAHLLPQLQKYCRLSSHTAGYIACSIRLLALEGLPEVSYLYRDRN